MKIPVVGSSYQSMSIAADCQKTVNLYVEQIESGAGKSRQALYPTPGLRLFATLPDVMVRGLFESQGRVYAVAGGSLCELHADGTSTVLGAVVNDGQRASMRTNGLQGHQLFVVTGGYGYIYDTNSGVFTALTTVPGFPSGEAVNGTFLDGYFIVATTTSFQLSALFDGLQWNATDKAVRSMGADGIVCAFQNHRELWVWGEVTSEVWYNAGTANFPFAPIEGVFVEMGCGAKGSPDRFDNQSVWLARNRDGDRMAVIAAQYVPQRISTHAVETAWRRYERTDDAVSFCYQQDGHNFYVLSFPTAQATWVYDAATKLWHERGYWNSEHSTWEMHRAITHCYAFDQHLLGDRATGQVYTYDLAYAFDGDRPIRRMRRLPHLARENRRQFYTRCELEMETGIGHTVPPATPPEIMLRWSDDRGHTWSPEWWRAVGHQGDYAARVYWERLGSARDRVFELSMTADTPWRLIDGYLTVESGTS